MTRRAQHYARCPDCQKDAICPECGKKISMFSPFSNWLRNLSAPYDSSHISLHNLDFIWHNYKENWFITIEEKQHGGRCTGAQRDTHGIIYQLLSISSKAKGLILTGIGQRRARRLVEYKGHYVIRFEKTNPEDSEWIEINKGTRITKEDLLHLLRTGSLREARQYAGN